MGLETCDGGIVQLLLPVERGRAVISQQLAGILGMHRFSKASRFFQIWFGCLAPDQVSVRCIGNPAGNRGFQPAANAEEAFPSSVAGKKLTISGLNVAGQ